MSKSNEKVNKKTKKILIGNRFFTVSSPEDDKYLDSIGEVFEPDTVLLLTALIDHDDIVADIGANIGLTSLYFSQLVEKTYAFEPNPIIFQFLAENIHNNQITNVEIFNIGLGESRRTAEITFSNMYAGAFVSEKIKPTTGHQTLSVTLDTLDDFFNSVKPMPTFLKIDAEGFEMNILKGGNNLLKQKKPIVLMEMNHFCLSVIQRIPLPDFVEFMASTFPYLYAVEIKVAQNSFDIEFVDLKISDNAYFVMHDHVTQNRFPNLIGGFDRRLPFRLNKLKMFSNLTIQRGKEN